MVCVAPGEEEEEEEGKPQLVSFCDLSSESF